MSVCALVADCTLLIRIHIFVTVKTGTNQTLKKNIENTCVGVGNICSRHFINPFPMYHELTRQAKAVLYELTLHTT